MPNLKYETNGGIIGRTRVNKDPGYITIAGAEPAGGSLSGVYFYKSKTKRCAGIQVRHVNLRSPDGPPTPSGQQPYLFARGTVLTPGEFSLIQEGDTYDIDGVTFEVYSKTEEG